jgi:small-conductance mechanosensitive channel
MAEQGPGADAVNRAAHRQRYVSATSSPIRSKRREVALRTAVILAVGFVLWAACLGVARLLASSSTSSMITATVAFVVLWCVAAAANMWVGVSHAGYSFREELPIFLLIFLLPSAVAVFVKWKFL